MSFCVTEGEKGGRGLVSMLFFGMMFLQRINCLGISPQVLLDVAAEDVFLRTAGGEEGLADGGFDVGCDGTASAMVLVVTLEGEAAEGLVLEGALQML